MRPERVWQGEGVERQLLSVLSCSKLKFRPWSVSCMSSWLHYGKSSSISLYQERGKGSARTITTTVHCSAQCAMHSAWSSLTVHLIVTLRPFFSPLFCSTLLWYPDSVNSPWAKGHGRERWVKGMCTYYFLPRFAFLSLFFLLCFTLVSPNFFF